MQTAVLESALPFSSKKAMSKSSGENGQDFEFCEVCRLNHDQGRRHKYFPSHARALAAVLARFHGKLSDIRFFLRNPSSLSPEHAVLNHLWCLFCRCDLRELGSSFACSNTIKHLASSEHLRNLKEFLRKHGGGMDRVDSFRVSEAELLKWEKGCETLNNATTSSCERSIGPSTGSSKEMRIMIINMIRQLVDPQLEVSSHILLLLGPWIYRGILAFPAPMSLVVFQGIYQTDILHVLPVMQKA